MVLVLCTGNSCRSQMMQGYLQHFAGKKARVYSAGIETHGDNSKAVAVMKEDGTDISHYSSNHIDEYRAVHFDLVLTVCDDARENCPWYPGGAKKRHESFPDPAKAEGSEGEVMGQFRKVRDEIKKYAQNFVNKELS